MNGGMTQGEENIFLLPGCSAVAFIFDALLLAALVLVRSPQMTGLHPRELIACGQQIHRTLNRPAKLRGEMDDLILQVPPQWRRK
jgi:hypothetical protein